MAKCALGMAAPIGSGMAELLPPVVMSTEERVRLLEQQIIILNRAIALIRRRDKRESPILEAKPLPLPLAVPVNKDGLPVGLVCYGVTEKSQFPFCITVEGDCYALGAMKYASLSGAAQSVSGVRRSGWAFWRLPDGRTLKEVFRKR